MHECIFLISADFNSNIAGTFYFDLMKFKKKTDSAVQVWGTKVLITDLEYESTHSGAGRQHQEDVREEHEITLTLLLSKTSSINTFKSHKTHFLFF